MKDKPQRRGPHPLSWVNLVLMLCLFTVLGYGGWLGWQQLQQGTAEMAVVKDRLAQVQQQAETLAKLEQELTQRASSLQQRATELQAQVAHNTDRLGKLPGAERQDWLLAEVEYLLRLANQRLQLERDWSSAISLLQAADNVLLETRNPQFNGVRGLIADEILLVRSVPTVDVVGAVQRIQTLQQQIPNLPWLPQKPDLSATTELAQAEVASTEATETIWYQTLWQKAQASFTSLVRIRQHDAPLDAPLSPDQQYYLQQNMNLMLEQAQVALLREQQAMYQHSLTRVSNWLDAYIMLDNDLSLAVRESLAELQGWQVAPPVPDISGSLRALQAQLEQQRRGTVVPAQANGNAETQP